MVSSRTGIELEDTSRTNLGGLGLEEAVLAWQAYSVILTDLDL